MREPRDRERASDGGSVVWHAVAFVYLAGLLGVLWSAMKAAPAVLLLAPLAGHAVAAAVGAERARRVLGGVSFWCAIALASTVGLYALAEAVAPPVTSDGHPVMPIGQAFAAGVLGPIVGVAFGVLYARRAGGATRRRAVVLHALFAVLAAIAAWRVSREL